MNRNTRLRARISTIPPFRSILGESAEVPTATFILLSIALLRWRKRGTDPRGYVLTAKELRRIGGSDVTRTRGLLRDRQAF
jgi:hypothetical protein